MGPAWEVRLQQMKDSWEVKVSPDPTRPALASFIPTPAQPPFSSPYTKGSLLIAPHELTLNEKPIKFKITKSMHTLSITQHGGKEPPCVQNRNRRTSNPHVRVHVYHTCHSHKDTGDNGGHVSDFT